MTTSTSANLPCDKAIITPCDSSLREKGPVDGSVLLSVSRDVILKLNSVGTLAWEVFEEGKRKKLWLRDTEAFYGLIGRLERCLSKPIQIQTVRQDFDNLLGTLVLKNLLRADTDVSGHAIYRIAEDTFWSNRLELDSMTAQGQEQITLPKSPENTAKPARLMTLEALFFVIAYDLLLKIGGFARMHCTVKRWPLKKTKNSDAEREVCSRLCAAVDQAQTYYFRRALCLQRSAIATCMLRSHGIAAEMVIGAHMMPFRSHAWVEVAGQVVNDNQKVQGYYECVIERLSVAD
jgi:hypothetical protein